MLLLVQKKVSGMDFDLASDCLKELGYTSVDAMSDAEKSQISLGICS